MKTTRGSLTYIFVSMIAGVILLSSFYQYWTQKKVALEWSRDKTKAEIRLLSNEVSTVLKGVARDLFTLRDLPQLNEYINARTANYRKRMLSDVVIFSSFFLKTSRSMTQ